MALLTAAKVWKSKTSGVYETLRVLIKSGTQLYEGQFVQFDSGGELIAYAADAAGSAGSVPLGRVLPTKKDRDDATYLKGDATTPRPEAIVFAGSEVLEGEAVTGAASQADVGKAVYLNAAGTEGDRVLTLTSTSNGTAVGFVRRWITGTTCDVETYDFQSRKGL